jgi:CO/xanthine dehydrogenase FAD-binding subunit
VGGNIANASPAADSVPALFSYDARLELVSASGSRRVEYGAFHHGYKKTELKDDELIARVLLPIPGEKRSHYFRKVGTRRFQSISKVCLAAWGRMENGKLAECRLVWGAVGPVPLRTRAVESALVAGRSWKDVLATEITPMDDIRSTREYRLRVAENLLEEFLRGLG